MHIENRGQVPFSSSAPYSSTNEIPEDARVESDYPVR